MNTLDPRALKPCPFCGGEPELMDTLPSGSLWYRCEECSGETEGGKTEAEAIAAWNRRASPQPALAVMGLDDLPERNLNEPVEQQGLFRKFDVRRVDGSDAPGGKHHGCRYFVLDVDHDQHAMAALSAYAAACEATHPDLARDLREKWGAPLVAPIDALGCTGKVLVFDPGALHVNKDGSGDFVVDEGEWTLEDDRCEGPDGPQGSVHWTARLDASEMQALRDFLNGSALVSPPPSGEGVCERIADTVLEWMVKHNLLDADNEYNENDILEVLKDLAPALSISPATADGWRTMDTLPATDLVIAGSYNGKGQWCCEVAHVDYIREHLAKIASGSFKASPHLAWEYSHWLTLPAAPTATGGR